MQDEQNPMPAGGDQAAPAAPAPVAPAEGGDMGAPAAPAAPAEGGDMGATPEQPAQ